MKEYKERCRICGRGHQCFYRVNKLGRTDLVYYCDFNMKRKPRTICIPLVLNLPIETIISKKVIKFQKNEASKLAQIDMFNPIDNINCT